MIKKYIPEQDLKILIEFLRVIVEPDLEYQAVYEAVMSSFSVQSRLFKALTDRKDAFVDVKVRRKPQKIILKFSDLPQSLVSSVRVESDKHKNIESEPLQVEKVKPVIVEPVQVEKIDSEPLQVEISELVKRKGRGKGKKQSPARSLVSVLIDNSDIKMLSQLGDKHDMSQSQLIRSAVKRLLQQMT